MANFIIPDDKNLPVRVETNSNLPALYNGGLPAEIDTKKAKKIKKPWINQKIKSVGKVKEFVKRKKNEMVVYKIIPHSGVGNNIKKLWKTIHKMYEMYESPKTRVERDGFKFTFRDKDFFWFDVVFKQVNGNKKVEFFVSTSEYQAKKLKRKLENKMKVTIEEATINDLQIPVENTIVQEVRYLKHDIFSLDTNTKESQTPIAGIMNTLDDMQFDGDMVRVSVCNEVESRKKWVKNASWTMEKIQKGKVPQRATISGKRISAATKKIIGGVVNEVNELVVDTFQALQNSFLKSEKEFKKEKVVEKPYSLEDEIGKRKWDTDKMNLPVFKSHIRVASHSKDKLTRDTLSETPVMALNEVTKDNELNGITIKWGRRKEVIKELNTLELSTKTKHDPNANLMSTDEMSKLALQMPGSDLQRRYSDELNAKKKIETDIPSEVKNKNGIWLGVSEYKDLGINVYLPTENPDDFYSGYTFIGKQGAGKDNSIQNFVYHGAMYHNISFVIPDWICQPGHKGMADGIRDLLPPEKIIDIDLANNDYITPMDLTEVVRKLGRQGLSRFGDEMIDFLNMGELTRSKKYIRDAAKASGGSLYNIKRIIEDENFRYETIERLNNEGNLRLANELIQWGTNDELGSKADTVLSRLDDFFGNDALFDIFAQSPKKEVDFEQWMREGKTIILRMPKRKMGRAAKTLAHWVTLKVLMTRLLMSEEDKEKHGCFMVFNEPEQVQSQGLSELMGRIATEGRKERLGSIFAFHHWNKLEAHLQENLQAGGVNQFLFANDHRKTFEKAESRLEPIFTVDDALQTPKHYAIAILNTTEPLPPFLIHMLPPIPEKERYDNSFLTKRHSRMFGRPWHEIQESDIM